MASLEMENLPGIPLVLGEDELMPPGLGNGSHDRPPPAHPILAPHPDRNRRSTSEASPASSALWARDWTRRESIAERPSLTPAMATGVTEISRMPRPTRTAMPRGSEASSPHTATGLAKRAPAPITEASIVRIAG